MFSRLIVAYVLTFMSLRLLAAEPHFAITRRVTDSEGAAIAKARLLIHSDSSGDQVSRRPTGDASQDAEVLTKTAEDVSVLTDANGSYSVNVTPGFYDVFVSAPMFTPIAASGWTLWSRKSWAEWKFTPAQTNDNP